MNSLPTELNLNILHHVRDSTPTLKFSYYAVGSMRQASAYNEFLLLMALYHRHWTAVAQSELFHHIILKDRDKTRLLLKLLRKRGNGVIRTYAEKASSMRLGYNGSPNQDYDRLEEHLDELAGYCPNIVEISCAGINNKFSDFRELSPVHAQAKLIKSMSRRKYKRLDRLNFFGGRHYGLGSFSLSITELSVDYCQLPVPLNPASFPFLSHLFFDGPSDNSLPSILPLLPQITSLTIGDSCSSTEIKRMLSASTSLTTISIWSLDFYNLDDGSCNVIKERFEVITVHAGRDRIDFSKLSECIAGSKVLKKVIIDGVLPTAPSMTANRIAELKKVVEACKRKKTVELWKENFTVNGKVDLNADVVSSFGCFDPWTTTYSSYRCYRQPHSSCYESVRA
jgi:hypothetical protein